MKVIHKNGNELTISNGSQDFSIIQVSVPSIDDFIGASRGRMSTNKIKALYLSKEISKSLDKIEEGDDLLSNRLEDLLYGDGDPTKCVLIQNGMNKLYLNIDSILPFSPPF